MTQGCGDASRTSLPAYWQAGVTASTCFTRGILTSQKFCQPFAAVALARELLGVEGFEPPSWSAPATPRVDFELDALRRGLAT